MARSERLLSPSRSSALLAGETATNADKPKYKDFKDWLLNGPKLDDDDPFFEALKRDPNDTGRDFEFE